VTARGETRLWLAQRASAAVLAICVVVHLAVIVYAVRGGLSAAEILGRTRGNWAWLGFYSVFVLAAAVHAPIGLRAIFVEWLGWGARPTSVVVHAFALALLALGLRAAWAVFGAP
jgi:fumarate reductase subunit C